MTGIICGSHPPYPRWLDCDDWMAGLQQPVDHQPIWSFDCHAHPGTVGETTQPPDKVVQAFLGVSNSESGEPVAIAVGTHLMPSTGPIDTDMGLIHDVS
jgi:hypothetical protein